MSVNEKKALRRALIKARASASRDERSAKSSEILNRILDWELYKKSALILSYVAIDGEIETRGLIERALKDGKRVAVPRCEGKDMFFCEIRSLRDVAVPDAFGIPSADAAFKLERDDLKGALCVAPALSCDETGARLGYGGGYYDRFLSENEVVSVSVCFESFMSEKLPFDERDVETDFIATEKRLFKRRKL